MLLLKVNMESKKNIMNKKHIELYREWLSNEELDKEIREDLINIDEDEIFSRFSQDLEFGTAGIRGVMGGGTNRINKYVIRKTTQGIANYLKDKFPEEKELKIVIAYDSRKNSYAFAQETALVFAANNIKAYLFEDIAPTPLLSFSVLELKCVAGIVITSSHNPPEYNGYKIYTEDGGQAVPNVTKTIKNFIEQIDVFKDVKILSKSEAIKKRLLYFLNDELDNKYLNKVQKLCEDESKKNISIVFTPLHGTGARTIPRALEKCGYENISFVQEQMIPDGNFPTIKTPNPEKSEAFELAFKKANEVNADLVLASDPDADRIGCAVKNSKGEYQLLNGNEMGALLLNYLITSKKNLISNSVVIKTIVTGDLGTKIAKKHNIEVEETLTGFKYIGEKINKYSSQKNKNFFFGYEESCGYLAGTFVRDKDATIASTLIVAMASHYKGKGKNLLQVLEDLHKKYGYHIEKLVYIELENLSFVDKILKEFLEDSFTKIGKNKILIKENYEKGVVFDLEKGTKKKILLPKEKTIKFKLENNSWFCIRPSGTEPKLKIYMGSTDFNRKKAKEKTDELEKSTMSIIQTC